MPMMLCIFLRLVKPTVYLLTYSNINSYLDFSEMVWDWGGSCNVFIFLFFRPGAQKPLFFRVGVYIITHVVADCNCS